MFYFVVPKNADWVYLSLVEGWHRFVFRSGIATAGAFVFCAVVCAPMRPTSDRDVFL